VAVTLVAIAEQFSPRYEQARDDLLSIDVRGLTRLLGTPRAIGVELVREAAARGLQPQVAVAGTRMAALVLARMRPGLTVVASGAEAAELASVPIDALEKITGDVSAVAWSTWGIRTLGELAALPASELIARVGMQAATWQAIARGEDVRPMIPTRPEERFDAALELEWPIEGLEPLSFVLTRLLEPLSTRLERRDRGVAVLQVDLGLITGVTHSRRLDLPSPIRDARTLRTLALLDLESHPPAAAVDRVAIVIEPTPGRVLQHTLFARAHPTPDVLSTLLARLGALMGQDRLGTPAIVDTHRPGVFEMKPFALEHSTSASHEEKARGPMVSVLRRCRHPVPARVVMEQGRPVRVTTERRGFAGGNVLASAGPWRSSGNWWSTCEAAGERARHLTGEAESLRSRPSGSEVAPASGGGAPRELTEVGPRGRSVLDTRENSGSSASGVGVGPHASKYWHCDEWDVALSDGALYRLGHDREKDCWFIDGIVD
jgi:protein ImuB